MDNKIKSRVDEIIRKRKRNKIIYSLLAFVCVIAGGVVYYNLSQAGFAGEDAGDAPDSVYEYIFTEEEVIAEILDSIEAGEEIGTPITEDAVTEEDEAVEPEEAVEDEIAEETEEDEDEAEEDINEEVEDEDEEDEEEEEEDEDEELIGAAEHESNNIEAFTDSRLSAEFSVGLHDHVSNAMEYRIYILVHEDIYHVNVSNRVSILSEYPVNGLPSVTGPVINHNNIRAGLISDMQMNGDYFDILFSYLTAGDEIIISYKLDFNNMAGYQMNIVNTCTITSHDLLVETISEQWLAYTF
jgi:hypothetical protein